MKSGDQPCIRWGRKWGWLTAEPSGAGGGDAMPLRSTGELSGSQTTMRVRGAPRRRVRPTPSSVPPVPLPVTKWVSGLSEKSARISGPVVRSWMVALASLSNCRGRNQPCVCASSAALATMPLPFCQAGVSTTLAPRKRINRRRSTLKFSAITITSG
ncbi:MAG: hypothetical protein ABIR26_00980 [Ramlibacter sp.]